MKMTSKFMLKKTCFNKLKRSISILFAKRVPYQYYSENDIFIAVL